MNDRCVAAALAACALLVGARADAQADLHELRWYVHVDMVTGSEPLSFWQAFIEQASGESEVLLKGNQGSVSDPDTGCCSELQAVSVGSYGSAGDGLDTPTSSQFAAMRGAIAGGDPGGSVAFLVRDIALCGGSSQAIGCAQTPSCSGNANDDPDLAMMLGVDAMQDEDDDDVPEGVGGMAQTLSHERGHNACLSHVSANPCELMAPSGDGGCLSGNECTRLREARTTTTAGDPCACHASGGGFEADGGSCTEGATGGMCTGGVCSPVHGLARVLVAAASDAVETGAPLDEPTDDLLQASDLPGGWASVGSAADAIQGLAWDPDRNVLWGVRDNGANDQIVQIDPDTGAITSTLTTLSGHPNVIALAFHPGATTAGSDDHLLAISAEPEADCDLVTAPPDFCATTLVEIDPASAAFQELGGTNFSFIGGLRGLAYDSHNGVLYAAAALNGLWRFTDLSCGASSCSCSGLQCDLAAVDGLEDIRVVPGLAYSAASNQLYLVGTTGPSPAQLLATAIDADSLATTPVQSPPVGVDGYTPGGVAALPLPAPGVAALPPAALLLAALARRRRPRHSAA